ncbi:uncharacterized protein [Nicotiana sylvestris]|uniref:uncharacterized protein n=1 Tax=Nicotiana sylvestris TaxID=4096 RepID=UPI00388C7E13
MCGGQDGRFHGCAYISYLPPTPYFDGSSFSSEVNRNKKPREADLKKIEDMLKCILEQHSKLQLQIERQEETIHNLKVHMSQLVEVFNAQQANIVNSIQEERELDTKIKELEEKAKVKHQQSIKLKCEDADIVEEILESTKDIENTYLVDSVVISVENVDSPNVHIERQEETIHNLKVHMSQLVEVFNAQQANIVNSIQEERELDTKIKELEEKAKVKHQQSIKLKCEDADIVEEILESTKDIENTYLVDSVVISVENVDSPNVHIVKKQDRRVTGESVRLVFQLEKQMNDGDSWGGDPKKCSAALLILRSL